MRTEDNAALSGSMGYNDTMSMTSALRKTVPFQRGGTDVFLLTCPPVGRLEKVKLENGSAQKLHGWHVDTVTITSPTGRQYFFHVDEWLSRYEGKGNLSVVCPTTAMPKGDSRYMIIVRTAHDANAGTSARAFVTLFGDNDCSTGRIPLVNNSPCLRPGTMDTFFVGTPRLGMWLYDIASAVWSFSAI